LQRRILVAAEARAYGRGGVQRLAQITGMSRQTIYRGLQDLRAKRKKPSGRIRRPGGGRKRLRDQQPRLVETLERLIEPTVRGDPQSLLRWTCKSLRNLEVELAREGYAVSYRTIANLLHAQEYSLQANRKTREGEEDHPDRCAVSLHQ
jgi:transposase